MRRLVSMMIVLLCAQLLLAQLATDPSAKNSAPKTVVQKLQEHHIGLTKKDLVTALRNTDPEVRSLAAAELASLRDSNAAESIAEAISTETVPATRTELANALAQMGKPEGKAALKQQCVQENVPVYLRIRAASYLLALDDNSCLDSVVRIVKTAEESNDKLAAMSFLSGVPCNKAPSNVRQQVESDALMLLDDPTPAVRMAAADALVRLESTAGTHALRDHIAKERDEVVQSQMKMALQRLKRQQDKKEAH